jgi:hypothetical protein
MQPRRRGSPPFNTFFHVTNKGLQKEKPTKHTPPPTPWPTLKLLKALQICQGKKTHETTQSHPTNPGTKKNGNDKNFNTPIRAVVLTRSGKYPKCFMTYNSFNNQPLLHVLSS